MRIVSDFRDYYDAVARTGVDPTVVYRRECRDLRRPNGGGYFPGDGGRTTCYDQTVLHSFAGRIAFCGEIFHFVSRYLPAPTRWSERGYVSTPWRRTVHYDRETMRQVWDELTPFYSRHHDGFDEWASRTSDLVPLFHEHASPVLLSVDRGLDERHRLVGAAARIRYGGEGQGLIVSPCLADFEFFRVVDPYSAFQRIAGFVSGVLGGAARETVEISDRDRVVKAGFDLKTSFRRPPSKGAAA